MEQYAVLLLPKLADDLYVDTTTALLPSPSVDHQLGLVLACMRRSKVNICRQFIAKG